MEPTSERPKGLAAFIVNDQGGILDTSDLRSWRSMMGLVRPDGPIEVPALASGHYRVVWWPGLQEKGLVAAACSGTLPAIGDGGYVTPGTTLTLLADPPK